MTDKALLRKYARRYSKDETVAWLYQEVRDLEATVQAVSCERDEYKQALWDWQNMYSELSNELTTQAERKQLKSQYTKDEVLSVAKLSNVRLMKKNLELKKEIVRWRDKYFDLVARSGQKNIGRIAEALHDFTQGTPQGTLSPDVSVPERKNNE